MLSIFVELSITTFFVDIGPPILTESGDQQFHQYQQEKVVINNSINISIESGDIDGIVDHHFLLLILVINNADIGGIVDHHFLC
jgi:inorganic pyrophosphatase/exopolyphosphatase